MVREGNSPTVLHIQTRRHRWTTRGRKRYFFLFFLNNKGSPFVLWNTNVEYLITKTWKILKHLIFVWLMANLQISPLAPLRLGSGNRSRQIHAENNHLKACTFISLHFKWIILTICDEPSKGQYRSHKNNVISVLGICLQEKLKLLPMTYNAAPLIISWENVFH